MKRFGEDGVSEEYLRLVSYTGVGRRQQGARRGRVRIKRVQRGPKCDTLADTEYIDGRNTRWGTHFRKSSGFRVRRGRYVPRVKTKREREVEGIMAHNRPFESTLGKSGPRREPGGPEVFQIPCPQCDAPLFFYMHWDEGAGPEFEAPGWQAEFDASESYHSFFKDDDIEKVEKLAAEAFVEYIEGLH